MKKTIEYYIQITWGTPREYFVDDKVANYYYRLTGRKTLDKMSRILVEGLSGGNVAFKQVLPPDIN